MTELWMIDWASATLHKEARNFILNFPTMQRPKFLAASYSADRRKMRKFIFN